MSPDPQTVYQQAAHAYDRAMTTMAPPAVIHAARATCLAALAALMGQPKKEVA